MTTLGFVAVVVAGGGGRDCSNDNVDDPGASKDGFLERVEVDIIRRERLRKWKMNGLCFAVVSTRAIFCSSLYIREGDVCLSRDIYIYDQGQG
jgi:hypothetical protein